MILFVQFVLATIILCPILAFLLTVIICRKLRMGKYKAIGYGADSTTAILFFSIPIAIHSLWGISTFIPLFVVALLIAIFFTYKDWRTKKEIEIKPLLKKIWRVYFLLLSTIYLFVWIIGLTHSIWIFMMIE